MQMPLEAHVYYISSSSYTYDQYESYILNDSVILENGEPIVVYSVFLGCGWEEQEVDLF